MNTNEKQSSDAKQEIRERYKGVDPSELEIIPAKPLVFYGENRLKRVAAYCRVSTENEEQTSSFELQKNYFTDLIRNQPEWELVDIYSDEGISGTSTNHREELKRLMEDCRAGKIDYIITKSIARFARNIVDCLNMIEELRSLNPPVGIIFESDHIDTLGGNDSLLLAIMASLAETESYNKSVIMNWSIENRFKRGIFLLPELLGFDKDQSGNLVVNEDEADTVKLCFYLFISGFSLKDIADLLTSLGRKTGYNKLHNKKTGIEPKYNTNWTSGSVAEILRNERHCGDVLARKTYTPNFKDHKSKKNVGQRDQVIKRDHHEKIVSREVFEAANKKLNQMYGRKDLPIPTLKVIDDGVLRGFVPVNRNWGGFTGEDFKLASQSVYDDEKQEKQKPADSVLHGYQVVRAQFFNTQSNPAVTISSGRIRFNSACLRRFEDVEYVEMLFNSIDKCLAIRPCQNNNPNAIKWGNLKNGKWIVCERSCRGFSAALFDLMNWNKELKYRMRGSYVCKDNERMMLFDLEEPEMIERVQNVDIPCEPSQISSNRINEPEEKQKFKRIILHPSAWSQSFGKEYDEEIYFLNRIHYSGNWDVLRPARDVLGINPITEDEITALLFEAEKIIDRLGVGVP